MIDPLDFATLIALVATLALMLALFYAVARASIGVYRLVGALGDWARAATRAIEDADAPDAGREWRGFKTTLPPGDVDPVEEVR